MICFDLMGQRILVVDDEPAVTDLLAYNLRKAHYEVLVAADGDEALRLARQSAPDLILLDLMIPEVDGLDVCRELRKTSGMPIIMITARGEEIDRVVGLELCAGPSPATMNARLPLCCTAPVACKWTWRPALCTSGKLNST
jgi:CheY-like chemotaxis protein